MCYLKNSCVWASRSDETEWGQSTSGIVATALLQTGRSANDVTVAAMVCHVYTH